MRRFLSSLMSAIARVFKFVWDPVRKVGQFVVDTIVPLISGVGQIAYTAATAVASVPAAVVKTILSPFRQQVAPAPKGEAPVAQQKQANAAAMDEQKQAEAVRQSLTASVDHAKLCRRFAMACTDNKVAPSLASLPEDIKAWLINLSDRQLAILAETDLVEFQRHLTGSVPLRNLPPMGTVAAAAPVPEPAPVRTADIVRPVFRKPAEGYGHSAAAAAAEMDVQAIMKQVASERAERDRIVGMQPMERLAEDMEFFERSKALERPTPAPRVPMAMSSR